MKEAIEMVLRVVIPVALILTYGYFWLKKVLKEADEEYERRIKNNLKP